MKVLSKNSVMEFVKKTAILWVMIILILILSVISPSFFRGQNLLNIIKQASITGVIGVGMTFVLITGNEDAARLSGVSTAKVKLFVYVFCGILSGIAGILICSRITSGNGTVAEGYEMNAISAAVIGGVSMTGGSGNVLGMVVGAMILTIIQNSFDIMGVNSFYQNIIKGIIILLAVFLDLRGKKKKN